MTNHALELPLRMLHADPRQLLSRRDFRESVLARHGGLCCVEDCGKAAVDAHHIIERRLWIQPQELGGYFLENGAAVCEEHHLACEMTTLSADAVRIASGISIAVVPGEFYLDSSMGYTKWGDPILADGQRLPGPLFWDESVQKILAAAPGILELYRQRVKYPRTLHLPWSPGRTKDDRVHGDLSHWLGRELVVTEKMDGENTTVYSDGYTHARSVDSDNHQSRNRLKADIQKWAYDLPQGWRACGENLTAVHSITYEELPDRFLLFSLWDRNHCLSWDETIEWAELLGLSTPPLLWRGVMESEAQLQQLLTDRWQRHSKDRESEGYVVRPAEAFGAGDFHRLVGKYVRENHVSSAQHWRHRPYEENSLKADQSPL